MIISKMRIGIVVSAEEAGEGIFMRTSMLRMTREMEGGILE